MLAINKEVFESILQNTVNATNSWIPKGMIGNKKYNNLYDPKKAKEIIDRKNLKNTKIKFLFPESSNNRLIAEVLQSMWKENLKINVDIQGLEWKVYLSALDSDRPNMFRAGWAADYPDPHNFMNLFTCKSGNNETGWCDKVYDELIRKSSSEIDEKERIKYYDKAQEILIYKENVIIPLYESNQIYLKSSRLEDFEYSKMGIINFSDLNLKN